MSNDNETVLRRMLALWAEADADAMADMFAEDCVYLNVPTKKPMEGREAVRTWLKMCFQHLTRIDVEIINLAVNGEWILNERLDVHVIGDKRMPLPVMNACRVVDGKIQTFRDYYDHQTVIDLGMLD